MPLNYDTEDIIKARMQLFAGVSIPAGGARITVTSAGLPDPTQNPNYIHIGYTREGSVLTTQREMEEDFADEFKAAIRTSIKTTGMNLTGELLQVANFKLLELLTVGVGSFVTASGIEQITFGESPIDYNSIVGIFPTEADPTKFGVVQLYRALNQAGLELAFSAKKLAGQKFDFKAYEVTGRAATDTLGTIWQQTA